MSSVPLSEQPENIRELFQSRASGRTISPEALYDKVPAHLTNNPEDVAAYMEARDVSRIISGENGGDYTDENTVLELSGPNRARQARNVTSQELEHIDQTNAADALVIDSDGDVVVDAIADRMTDAAILAEGSEAAGTGISELAGPLVGGMLQLALPAAVGTKVYKRCPDHWGAREKGTASAAAALVTLGVVSNPVGATVVGGIALWKMGRAIHRFTQPLGARWHMSRR